MRLSQDDLAKLSAEEKRELVLRQLRHGDVQVEGTAPGRRGYVTIADASGRVRQVPYTKARTAYYKPGSIQLSKAEIESGGVVGRVPIKQEEHQVVFDRSKAPIRRTAEQRLESLTNRLMAEARATQQRTGRFEMDENILRSIEGEYWKAGMPVTRERLREAAKRSLLRAEKTLRAQGKFVEPA